MKFLNYKDIVTNDDDTFLYDRLIVLFKEIKLIQSGSGLDSTLRHHRRLQNYCMAKQSDFLNHIEERYFLDDGSICLSAINDYHNRLNLQN